MLKYLFAFAIFLYLLSNIFSHTIVNILLSVSAFLAVISTIFYVSRVVLIFGIIFLSIGVMLLASNGTNPLQYLLSFGGMLNLLSLFALIPILALPIRLGEYANEVQHIIRHKVKNSGHLYMVSSGISYFLSSFMNLAALPMTYYSIRPSVDIFYIKNKERFLTRSITHGFAMPLLWTPVTPIVGIVIEMTGVSYGGMLPILIPLSILGLILDWLTGYFISQKRQTHVQSELEQAHKEMAATVETNEVTIKNANPKRLFHILLAILLLNTIITMTEHFLALSFLFLVSVLVIPFSFTWSLLLKKGKSFLGGLNDHFQNHLIKMKDQFFIFLSAGFFIAAINHSGADQTLNLWIAQLIGFTGVQLFLVILPIVPLLFAFIGLHPAVALALIAQSLDPNVLNISPVILTVAMLGGAVPAFLMGPYNATLGIMSNIINESPFKISNWNFVFTFWYMVLLTVFLLIIQMIL
ncbi:hypothetical protein [Bacillus sp. FJAT-45350]|uniref:hypothetical protein n=1 Tax=Bacillus sp. FJAT-45350 TaxID=2011014 RepID=UPI000BB8EF33|nr:hypothetical protein [Bacillus sp. FJAT-45350]